MPDIKNDELIIGELYVIHPGLLADLDFLSHVMGKVLRITELHPAGDCYRFSIDDEPATPYIIFANQVIPYIKESQCPI